jgi:hypothetical protein
MAIVEHDTYAFDPTILSVSSLARMDGAGFDAVIAWVHEQRAARAQRVLENEAHVAKIAEEMRPRLEAQAAALAAAREREPWKF